MAMMDKMDKKRKLPGMPMPEKRAADKALEIDLEMPAGDDGADQEENPASDLGDEELMESPSERKKETSALQAVSDEELMAEIHARGLGSELASKSPAGQDDDEISLRA